jgi:hypothetical protein
MVKEMAIRCLVVEVIWLNMMMRTVELPVVEEHI